MARLIDKSIPKFLLVGVGNTLLSMVLMFLLEEMCIRDRPRAFPKISSRICA